MDTWAGAQTCPRDIVPRTPCFALRDMAMVSKRNHLHREEEKGFGDCIPEQGLGENSTQRFLPLKGKL